MMDRRKSKLAKWAKYGVLAIVVADGLGIYLAHHRLSQPLASGQAVVEEPVVALADPVLAPASGAVQAVPALASNDVSALPAASRFEAIPALMPMKIETIEEVTSPKMAARAPQVPTVSMAETRPTRNARRSFSSAFSRDVYAPSHISADYSSQSYVRSPVATDVVPQFGAVSDQGSLDAPATRAENPEAVAPPQGSDVGPDLSARPDVPAQTTDSQPAPSAPAANDAPASELPAS
jgi:hypothetical protein